MWQARQETRFSIITVGLALSLLVSPTSGAHAGVPVTAGPGCIGPTSNASKATVFVSEGTELSLSGESLDPPYSLGLPFCLSESVTLVGSWTASQRTETAVLDQNSTSFDWPNPWSYAKNWTYNETLFPGSYDLYFFLVNSTSGTVNITGALTFEFDRTTVTLQPTGEFDVAPKGNVSWPFTIPNASSRIGFMSDEAINCAGGNAAGVLTITEWRRFEADPSSFDWQSGVWFTQGSGGVIGPLLSAEVGNVSAGDYVLVFFNNASSSSCTLNMTTPLYLAFTPGHPDDPTFEVSFSEVGPMTGYWWDVSITGGPSLAGNGKTVATALPNGSYSYAVVTLSPYWRGTPGSVVVNGTAVADSVTFVALRYTVSFTESGLPSRVLSAVGWTVELNGTVERSHASTLSIHGLPNGTYSLLVVGPSGHTTPIRPSQTVAGNTTVNVVFTRGRTLSLTFTEGGLPRIRSSVQRWCVEVGGWKTCSSRPSQTFENLTSGSYAYAVLSPTSGQATTASVSGMSIPLNGTLDVERSEEVKLKFVYRYAVTFTESGLTSGTWSLSIRGHTETAAWNRTIEFNLTNGTYTYRVGSEVGYKEIDNPPRVRIEGSAASVAVTFTQKG